ncbi:MAG: transglycosylase SLT domain-containing protein [Cellvibrio sp.]
MAINDLSLNASPLMPFSTTAESSPRPNNLDAAAQEFEALFLQQVLKQMRKATDALSSEHSFKSNTLSTYQEFYDQALAQKLAQGKQTGLADLIVKQLSPANSNPSAVSQSVSADQHFTANATSNTQATPFNGTRSLFTEPARESLRVADDNAFLQLYRNAPTSSALSQPLTRLGEKLANELSLMGNRFGEALSKSDFYQLVKRVIKQESSGRIDAVSPKGALGLMQLMPSTAREMAQEQGLNYSSERLLKDPHYNMRLGTAYLQKMLKRYDHSTPLALAAYNAGPGRVDEWLSTIGDPRTGEISEANWVNRIPLSETRHYTQSILGEFNPRNGRVAFK